MHTLKDLVTLRSSFPLKDSIYSLLLLYNSIGPSYYSRMSSTDFALSHLEMCPMSACAVVLCVWAPFPSRPCHAQSSCQLVCQGKEQSVSKCWGCRTPGGDLNAAPASWLCLAQPWPLQRFEVSEQMADSCLLSLPFSLYLSSLSIFKGRMVQILQIM